MSKTFESICHALRRAVHSSGASRMPNRFGTSDVVQEGVLQIWVEVDRNGKQLSEINTELIRRIAIGHICKLQRRNLASKRNINKESLNVPSDLARGGEDPIQTLAKCEQSLLMLESLSTLNPLQREIIVRRFFEEESFETIAGALEQTRYRVQELFSSSLETMQQFMDKNS